MGCSLGGLTYVVLKMILDYKTEGLPADQCPGRTSNKPQKFHRSFFSTTVIFFSMLALVLPFFYEEIKKYNQSRREMGLPKAHPYGKRAYWLSLLPGLLDIAAVELSMMANKALGAVAMLLLKSLRIVIAAFLTRFILHKAQKPYQWLGVCVTMLGLIPVGYASQRRKVIYAEPGKKSSEADGYAVLISIGLVIVSEAMRGVRYVYEEKLIKVERLSAEFVVFTESIIGLVVSMLALFVVHVMPGDNCGSRENFYDTIAMMNNAPIIWGLFVLNFFLVGIHNYSTTLITKHLTSMHNQIISQARTIVAWLPSVILYKAMNGKTGEPIDIYTLCDFAGFFVLAMGAFVYNGDVRVPCASCYPLADEEKQVASDAEKDTKSPSTSNELEKKDTVTV